MRGPGRQHTYGPQQQVLARVVNFEKPELEETRQDLVRSQNEFMMRLDELERALLQMLTDAEGDILANVALIEGLEDTKRTSQEISVKVEQAKVTEVKINESREVYVHNESVQI